MRPTSCSTVEEAGPIVATIFVREGRVSIEAFGFGEGMIEEPMKDGLFSKSEW
jgi:hypothetical protein